MIGKHNLKTWPEYFAAIKSGKKTFELRKNDRFFEVGDTLVLEEYDPNTDKYTGEQLYRKVTYLLKGGNFGLEEGFVIMGIRTMTGA